MRRDDEDKSACGRREGRLDESEQGTGAVRVIMRWDPQDQVMDGCVTACRVGKRREVWRAETDVKALGFWPEYFTDIENSRSLHESLHTVSAPALDDNNVI